MAITIDGVTYRNLPEQVEKNKTDIEMLKANIEGIKKNAFTDVDTTEYPTLADFLQSTGEEGIIYLYPNGNNFKQYIWEGEEWRFIGDTDLDITNMMTTDTEQTVKARKNVGLADDQRYKGYIKPITAGMEMGMLDDDGTNQYENPRIKISGYAFQVSTMQPINTTTDIGTESSKFRNLYQSGKTYSLLYTINNGLSDTFIVDGANYQTKSLFNFIPMIPSNSDLGISQYKWRNLYISGDIQKAEETIEFICPRAAALGLTLTTVATRATILNKTLNITVAFKLTNPTASTVSLGNTLEGFIKLDQDVFARIKDMNGNTLSSVVSSSSGINPIIGKGSYQNDNGYQSEGWVYLYSLAMTHWNLEDNTNTTRFHIVFRSGPTVRANTTTNFIANIEIPLDL